MLVALFASTPVGAQPLTVTHLAGPLGGPGTPLDGPVPSARFAGPIGICADKSGNLYVSDGLNAVIRKIDVATGMVTTVAGRPEMSGTADGTGGAARFRYPAGVTADGNGNLYVSDTSNHTIRKVVLATGVVSTLAGMPGSPGYVDGVGAAARFRSPYGIATDGQGNVFVADSENQQIRKIDAATRAVTTVAGPFSNPRAITYDGAGNVFFVTGYKSIGEIEIASGAVTSIALPPATFSAAWGMCADGAGNLYVTDVGNDIVQRVVIATGEVTIVAGRFGTPGFTDGTGYEAQFRSPYGVACDAQGDLFVADAGNSAIRKVSVASRKVTTFAGSGILIGSSDGVGDAARFYGPSSVTADAQGHLYVSDSSNYTIRRVDVGSRAVTTVAGTPGVAGVWDGYGVEARFGGPAGLADDGAGTLYVADCGNSTIRAITLSTRLVVTLAGFSGARGSADGVGGFARFNCPTGLALVGGDLYVADRDNYTIRKVEVSTRTVSTIAGSAGVRGSTDGSGDAARFGGPDGISSDSSGNLYVVDSAYHTIRKVAIATREVTTVAGRAGSYGSADGTGASARFYIPAGVAYDGVGNLFIADLGNRTIRRMSTATGAVTTVAGKVQWGGSADGTGEAARFMGPNGVAVDSSGHVFIADWTANVIRMSVPTLPDVATIDMGSAPVGQARQLDASPRAATSWKWEETSIPSSSSATLSSTTVPNPSFVPDVPGLYLFRLTATDGTATSITTVSLQAWLPPTAAVSGGGTVCPGGSATIQALLGGVSPWTVVWSDGVTQTGMTISPATRTVTPGSSTVYSVVSISDANATGTASGSASVVVGPPAGPAITAPAGVPAGSTGNVASVAARAGATWAWSATGGEITSGQGTRAIAFTAGESGFVELSVVERDASGCESSPGTTQVPIAEPAGFHPVAPCRLFDTRESIGPAAAAPALAPGEVRPLLAVGLCEIPANARSLAVNVTAVSPEAAGSITLFAADAAPPAAPGTVSFVPGRTRASNAVVRLPANGSGTLEARNDSAAGVDVLLDVSGYFR